MKCECIACDPKRSTKCSMCDGSGYILNELFKCECGNLYSRNGCSDPYIECKSCCGKGYIAL